MPNTELILVSDGQELPFNDGLYRTACPVCGQPLEWHVEDDNDDGENVYQAECCRKLFSMYTHTLSVHVCDYDDGEPEMDLRVFPGDRHGETGSDPARPDAAGG